MSVRRPKMQIKPKVSTRSMTSMAANSDVTNKQTTDSGSKLMDSSAKEVETEDQKSTKTLTTEVIAVYEEEKTESNEDKNNISDNINHLEIRQPIVDTIVANKEVVNEELNQSVENESKESEMDSKQQKDLENKPKFVSKPAKETNRKRKMSQKSGQKSDKSSMRMKDLLLYNPPLTEEQKEMLDKDEEQMDRHAMTAEGEQSNKVEDNDSNDTNCETNGGPRVKVGADGLLILDEESVIVKRKKSVSTKESAVIENAGATSACTNYASFRSKTKTSSKPRWTEHETIRFYSALNTIGTDFTLMANLFFRGKRTRVDLRNKYKKEEKVNQLMIDDALFSPNFMNHCPEVDDLLNDLTSDSDDELEDQSISNKQNSVQTKT